MGDGSVPHPPAFGFKLKYETSQEEVGDKIPTFV